MGRAGWLAAACGFFWFATAALALQPPGPGDAPRLNVADELPGFGLPSLGDGEMLTLKAEIRASKGGPDGEIIVTGTLVPEWHVYSVTQPPKGPLRTKIELISEPKVELKGAFKPDQTPKIRELPDVYPGVKVEEHYDEVTWRAPIRIPSGVDPDHFAVKVKVSGQVCRDGDSCIPVRSTLDAKLVGFTVAPRSTSTGSAAGESNDSPSNQGGPSDRVGANDAPPSSDAPPAPASEPARSNVGNGGASPRDSSKIASEPFSGKPGPYRGSLSHGTLNGRLEPSTVKAGETVNLVITGTPDPDWHFYVLTDKPLSASAPYRPTLVAVELPPGWERGTATANKEVIEKTADGKPVLYYEGEVTWTIPLRLPAEMSPGPVTLSGFIGYQTCDAKSCDRPTGAAFQATLQVAEMASASNQTPLLFAAGSYKKAEALATGTSITALEPSRSSRSPGDGSQGGHSSGADSPPDSPANSTTGAGKKRVFEVEVVTGGDENVSLGSVLILAVFGGFLLNFMPCVLPVIGLKVMAFVNQAHGDRRRVFILNLYYFLGLVAVFLGLATMAAIFQLGWGQQFQSTGFNVVLASVVFIFALSMLGVWEIPLPGFVGSGAAAEAAEHEGAVGAFLKGALTTVLATPCTGPFMGTALTWAAKQPTPIIYLTFLALGFGMGAPYLLIGAFPQLLRFLPKPGAWMDTFKQAMGFVLMGTVVFIFTFLAKDYVVATAGLLVGLGVACWWIGKTPVYAELPQKLVAWSVGGALAAIVGWSSFTLFGPSTAILDWQAFSRPEFEQLLDEGQTVMVDFTAEWCATCKVNESVVLNTRKTKELVDSRGVTVIKADMTQSNETTDAIEQLLIELGRKDLSIPFLVIFPGDGSRAIAFSGPITHGMLADALAKAGPSRKRPADAESLAGR